MTIERLSGLVELEGASRLFGDVRALDEVSLNVEEGEWVAVTGPSGSGKTTLLNLLAGLDRPSAGGVRVAGQELGGLSPRRLARYRRETVGIVFQEFHLVPYLTAVENVMLAQYVHSLADREEAAAALARVGLAERLDHLPARLSGGERQRVCVARALINHPRLVLADEPTGSLDEASEAQVLEILEGLRRDGLTLVMVTHAPHVALRADRVVRLEHGRLVSSHRPLAREDEILARLWAGDEGDPVRLSPGDLQWARQAGYCRPGAQGEVLTAPGRAAAAAVVRRQRLAEVLLARTLVDPELPPCGLLPPVSGEQQAQVDAFLGHPRHCPHGRRIPPAALARAPGGVVSSPLEAAR